MRSIVVTAAAAVLSCWLAPALPGAAQKGEADQQFVKEAWEASTVEVTLGQVAMKNAASEEVKQFGKRMVDDHMKANGELLAIVNKNKIFSPKGVSKKHQEMMDRLSAKQGAAFDREYMKMMVDDHQMAVGKFEKATKELQDAELRGWAARTLPTLRDHLILAQKIEQKVSAKEGGK
jgi:putative membrane protein